MTECEKYVDSATEIEGSDGAAFTLDPGHRATVTLRTDGSGDRTASDPDVFRGDAGFVLYVSHGPSLSVWTSADLRGTFARSATSAICCGSPRGRSRDHHLVHSDRGRLRIRRALLRRVRRDGPGVRLRLHLCLRLAR